MGHLNYKGAFLIFLVLLITAEIIWSWQKDKKVYNIKDSFANIAIIIGFHLSKFLLAGYQLFMLEWASRLSPFHLPDNAWILATCFILADLIYYWFHRVSHRWAPLWAFHLTHHSSLYMNLTTAYRLNWLSVLISPFFFLPLAFLGFSPSFIALCYAVNLLYQFFMHTEAIGKWGRLEGILNSPSAHRVHHGSNPAYLDKNFGGVFMIWDRLFKTYQPETERPKYGTTTGFISNNPFRLVFKGFLDLFTGKMKYPFLLAAVLTTTAAESQVIVVSPPPRRPIAARKHLRENGPVFRPSWNLSVGYGFPNVDRQYLPEYYAISQGNISQSGIVTGALNYQFSRRMSIGIMVAHGSVSAPYYDYYSSVALPDFSARLETWSFMINLVRYIPVSRRVTPYIKTAIGFNSWKQEYKDANGNKAAVTPVDLPDFAHQVALGVKFRLSERAAFFVEGGYGKYIVLGGLSVKI